MNIRIGVTQSPKEIEVELDDDADPQKVTKEVEAVLSSTDKVLWFTDRRGRKVGVPAAKVAYVEISPHEDRRVGFGVA